MERNGRTLEHASIPNSLRKRLFVSFLAIISVLSGLNIVTLAWTGKYYRDLSGKINTQVIAHEASLALARIDENLGSYASSGNRAYLELIAEDSNSLHDIFLILATRSVVRSPMYYQAFDATTMVASLDEEIASIVTEKIIGTSQHLCPGPQGFNTTPYHLH